MIVSIIFLFVSIKYKDEIIEFLQNQNSFQWSNNNQIIGIIYYVEEIRNKRFVEFFGISSDELFSRFDFNFNLLFEEEENQVVY